MRSRTPGTWITSFALSLLIFISHLAECELLFNGEKSNQVSGTHSHLYLRKGTLSSERDEVKLRYASKCSSNCRSMKGLESSHVIDPVSNVHAMQEQIQSAKQLATFVRVNRHPKLLKELKLQIKENEQILARSSGRSLPKSAITKLRNLERVMAKAGEHHSKCEATVKRLKASVLTKELEVDGLREESNYLGRLAARTMPKGLHCLSLQLTIRFYNQRPEMRFNVDPLAMENNELYHFVFYSENILAAAAVVNSTIFFAKEPHMYVFHILTDGLNYAAMQMWFQINKPGEAAVEIKNMDDMSHLEVAKPFQGQSRKYLKLEISEEKQAEGTVTKQQLQKSLPDIFPKLDKLLVVDDDILVQKDMASLWNTEVKKSVIGSVSSCATSKEHQTIWWSCLNIVDLVEWRRKRDFQVYKSPIHNVTSPLQSESLEDNAAQVELDDYVSVLNVDEPTEAEGPKASNTLIHYGGYAKPWLGLGLSKYRSLWTRFINYDFPLLQECNIHK